MKRRRELSIHRCEGFLRDAGTERSLAGILREAFPHTDAGGILASMGSMTQYFILRGGRVAAVLSHARRARARNGRAYANMIFNVATRKRYRGMGFMTLLLGALFRDASRKTFHLEVYSDNAPAISLYQKKGFRVIDKTRDASGRPILVMRSTPASRKGGHDPVWKAR